MKYVSLCLALLASLFASCQHRPPQQDPYLSGLGHQAPNGQEIDTESYWDGDGIQGKPRIRIDLSDQKAYYHKDDQLVGVSRISSGDANHRTPTGSFRVQAKKVEHRSSLYGDFVDYMGNVVVQNVDSRKDRPPPGAKFQGSNMPYFMPFHNGIGMHAGYLPGYPASHGCVRMPEHIVERFFANTPVGTPVTVVP